MGLRAFLVALAVGVALPAAATAANPARSAAVSLSGYDLTAPADVAQLHRDVVSAAWAVCRDQGARGVEELRLRRACAEAAVDRAIAAANAPTLTALMAALPQQVRYSARNYRLPAQAVAAVEAAAGRRSVAELN